MTNKEMIEQEQMLTDAYKFYEKKYIKLMEEGWDILDKLKHIESTRYKFEEMIKIEKIKEVKKIMEEQGCKTIIETFETILKQDKESK